MGRKVKDISGLKFNRWTVLSYVGQKYHGVSIWICKCDCGVIKEVRSDHLKNGRSKSCGCFMREFNKNNKTTHGYSKTLTYQSWEAMKQRCFADRDEYKKYTGDMLCERWLKFENFLEDMGERPHNHEIHRIENDRGYYPENCEWKDRILHRQEHL